MFGWEGICEFVSVAEQGGFTPAARKLGVSVAQVSRQVAQLEDRLQAKLLLRTTRQVRLTELGEIYFRHCRQLLDNLYEAELAVGRHQAVPQGSLRITAPVSYGESRIAPLVNDFMVRFPQLEVTLNLTNQLLDLVHEGYDLALRLGHLKDSSLVARKLSEATRVAARSPPSLPLPQPRSRRGCRGCGPRTARPRRSAPAFAWSGSAAARPAGLRSA